MNHKESAEMSLCIAWLEAQYPEYSKLCFHVPNEFVGSIQAKMRRKKQGVRAGVPDLFHMIPTSSSHGLIVELKPPAPFKSQLSSAQKWWISTLEKNGYTASVCKGFIEYQIVVKEYFDSISC